MARWMAARMLTWAPNFTIGGFALSQKNPQPLHPAQRRRRMASGWGFTTKAIHGGKMADAHKSVAPPLYQTATFYYDTADEGARLGQEIPPGYVYTRWANPTTRAVGGKAGVRRTSGRCGRPRNCSTSRRRTTPCSGSPTSPASSGSPEGAAP